MVPDGVVKVMLGFGEPLRMLDAVRPSAVVRGASLVNAVRTTAAVGEHSGLLHGVTVLLTPLGAYRIFAVPMAEWADHPLDVVDLLGTGAGSLLQRLAECREWGARFDLLDTVLLARLRAGPRLSPEVVWAWRAVRRSQGTVPVAELAAATGWSRRHLERRFLEQVGLAPKRLAQVVRLQRALRLQEDGMSWAQVAAAAEYHDEPHFDRTFKSMIGCTPGRFRVDRAHSAAKDPLDFLPGHITGLLLTG